MKLVDTIILSISVLLSLIGIHETIMHGFAPSYWLFMLSFGGLLWYQTRKKKQDLAERSESSKNKASESSKKRKYKM